MCWQWYVFIFNKYGTLCNNIITGRRISKTSPNNDIIIIESFQLSIFLRYDEGMTVTYFDRKK